MTQKILLISPYNSGSHKLWCEKLMEFSHHEITLLELPGRYWKWRMEASAIELAQQYKEKHALESFDILLCTDMLDLPLFLTLARIDSMSIKKLVYYHENQFQYPINKDHSKLDLHYGFKNYTNALCADLCFFNSDYNRNTFVQGVERLLKMAPDFQNFADLTKLSSKLKTSYLGINCKDVQKLECTIPVFLWNHRVEFDKRPVLFLETLLKLKTKFDFKLNFLGGDKRGLEVEKLLLELKSELIESSKVERQKYYDTLKNSSIMLVTSIHEFFGFSVLEAAYCGLILILPKDLSYPELYTDLHCHFYEDEIELEFILEKIFYNFDLELSLSSQNREKLMKFDWANRIESFDRLIIN